MIIQNVITPVRLEVVDSLSCPEVRIGVNGNLCVFLHLNEGLCSVRQRQTVV